MITPQHRAVQAAVVATLRALAEWHPATSQVTEEEWLGLAREVEGLEPGWACPLCQEVTCDDGCPLAPVRAAMVVPSDEVHARAQRRLGKAIAEGKSYAQGRDFLYALHLAGLLPQWPHVGKVVIMAQAGAVTTMYVEAYPGANVLGVVLSGEGIKVVGVPIDAGLSRPVGEPT